MTLIRLIRLSRRANREVVSSSAYVQAFFLFLLGVRKKRKKRIKSSRTGEGKLEREISDKSDKRGCMQTLTYASVEAAVAELTDLLPLLRQTIALADSGAAPPLDRDLYERTLRTIALLEDRAELARRLATGRRADGRVEFRFSPAAAAFLERRREEESK
jgi:hypothetical protein